MIKGGRKSGREEEEGKNRLAWLQSKRAEEDSVFSFFPLLRLRLAAAVTDGLCMRMRTGCGCLCARAHCRGAHPSAFPRDAARTWEKALAARKKKKKKHPATLKQYQRRVRSQHDQRKQRKEGKKKKTANEKRARGNKVERGIRGGMKEKHGRK